MDTHRAWRGLLVVLAVSGLVVWPLWRGARADARPLTPEEQGVREAVRALWQQEDTAAVSGDGKALSAVFDLESASGRASLRHAQARAAFVQAWAKARGVRWTTPQVSVRTPRIRFDAGSTPTTVTVTAIVSERWSYAYDGQTATQAFGLGREHWMTLIRTAAGWRIAQDWFTDPLDQDTRIPGPAVPSAGTWRGLPARSPRVTAVFGRRGYSRAGAVGYADHYCGAAPGCGNDGRYNPRFRDYNGDGGDCTNFVSQALALGGKLRQSSVWTFDPRTGEGTEAWVQASALLDQLLATGRARVIARGTYAQVVSALPELQPGDIIGYMEKGEVQHLALVVGTDPRGYTLVDSHTADRHHVPWDIGWDRRTIFVLVHMR